MAKAKYTIRKYDGDDQASWAVFKSLDIKGITGVVCYGEAKPIVSGCYRSEAQHARDRLNKS